MSAVAVLRCLVRPAGRRPAGFAVTVGAQQRDSGSREALVALSTPSWPEARGYLLGVIAERARSARRAGDAQAADRLAAVAANVPSRPPASSLGWEATAGGWSFFAYRTEQEVHP